MTESKNRDLLQGTLDLLILKTLGLQPLHGWGIARRIQQLSSDVLQIQQGSLYPALYRLQDRGLLRSEWGQSDEGRQVKVYRLTEAGVQRLADETRSWREASAAVEAILAAS
ncbi:MAG: PadR family transcriptional regulator [Thermoanaerobaculia bacterium]|nr:PadR family transcriptional regulator [Thermoanaerobaculia bacterium]